MSRKRTRTHHHQRLPDFQPGEQLKGRGFGLGGHETSDRRVAIEWLREFEKRKRAQLRSGSPNLVAILADLERLFFPGEESVF